MSVRAVLRHVSAEPGAMQLVAQLSRKPFSAFVQYDNLASNFAGPNEVLLSGSSNSFTSFGEQLQGMFYNTLNREELFGQSTSRRFSAAKGSNSGGYAGKGNSQPGGALAATGFDGNYQVGGLGLAYPVIRSRRLNLSVDSTLDDYDPRSMSPAPTGYR